MNKLTILVIDDERSSLFIVSKLIGEAFRDAIVLTAADGGEGIELARTNDPDVILLDILMPEMDGFEVCRRLKSDDKLNLIPVVFLTGFKSDPDVHARALSVGAEGFLTKPVNEHELIAQIRSMAKIRQANRSQQEEKERLQSLVAERTKSLEQELAEHRRAENELALSEARFKDLFENMREGVAVYRPLDDGTDFIFTAFNTAAERIDGQKREDLLGRSVLEMRPGIKKFGLFDVFQRVARTGNPERYPVAIYEDEKLSGWYENFVFRFHSGEIVAIYNNLTEQKLAESQKKRNELRLKSLLNILQYRPDSVQAFLDNALEEAIKLTESAIGFISFYNEESRQFVMNSWSKDTMKECAVVNPQRCYELDKTGIWGEAVRQRKPIILNAFQSAHPLKKGVPEGHVKLKRFMTVPVFKGDKIISVIAVANKIAKYDATDVLQLSLLMDSVWKWIEYKNSEELIRQSEKKYRALAENSVDTIMRFDRQYRHLYVNPVVQSQTGISPETFIGKTHRELGFPEELCMLWEDAIGKVFDSGRPNRIEFMLPSGIWVDWLLAPETDAQDNVVAVVSVARDITERKASERLLLESKQQLEKSLEDLKLAQKRIIEQERFSALGQLVGGVTHDFNNVLMPIVGFSELMLSDHSILKDHKEVIHMLQMINTAGKDARRIVKRLKSVYTGDKNSEYVMVDIAKVVESVISLSMPKWKEEMSAKGVSIEIKTDFDPVPRIKGNPGEIRDAVTNLLFNATDAMQNGGVINFRLSCEDDKFVILDVVDEGVGMDAETLSRCKEPFFTTKGSQGSGLGLSVANGIVSRHGGSMEITSCVNKGTKVRLRFPAASQDEVSGDVQGENVAADFTGLSVLVIDDETRSRTLIAGLLKASACNVKLADGGLEGLRLLR